VAPDGVRVGLVFIYFFASGRAADGDGIDAAGR
jgi:hypothetical protein